VRRHSTVDMSDVVIASVKVSQKEANHLLDLKSLLSLAIATCACLGDFGLWRSIGHVHIGHDCECEVGVGSFSGVVVSVWGRRLV